MINWEGSAHLWMRSRSSMITLNFVSQVTVGASVRVHESVFMPFRILSEYVSVGWVR